MEVIRARHLEERKIWATNQVLSLDEIVPGMVYQDQHGPKNPQKTSFLVGVSTPYEKKPKKFWAKFMPVDSSLISSEVKEHSLADRAVVPYFGTYGPHWNSSNWLEKIGTCLEIQNMEEIPLAVRNATLLVELGVRKLASFTELDGNLTINGLINSVLLDQIRKEGVADPLWHRVLVSRLRERLNTPSAKYIHLK